MTNTIDANPDVNDSEDLYQSWLDSLKEGKVRWSVSFDTRAEWDLELRDWTKWRLEHPYIKKGRHHGEHPTIEPLTHEQFAKLMEHNKGVLEAKHLDIVNGSMKSWFHIGVTGEKDPKALMSEVTQTLKTANDAPSPEHAATALGKAQGLAMAAKSLNNGKLPGVSDKPKVAKKKGTPSYKPGSQRAKVFDEHKAKAIADARSQSMTAHQAAMKAEEHRVIAEGKHPYSPVQVKHQGLAAGYQEHANNPFKKAEEDLAFKKEPEVATDPHAGHLKGDGGYAKGSTEEYYYREALRSNTSRIKDGRHGSLEQEAKRASGQYDIRRSTGSMGDRPSTEGKLSSSETRARLHGEHDAITQAYGGPLTIEPLKLERGEPTFIQPSERKAEAFGPPTSPHTKAYIQGYSEAHHELRRAPSDYGASFTAEAARAAADQAKKMMDQSPNPPTEDTSLARYMGVRSRFLEEAHRLAQEEFNPDRKYEPGSKAAERHQAGYDSTAHDYYNQNTASLGYLEQQMSSHRIQAGSNYSGETERAYHEGVFKALKELHDQKSADLGLIRPESITKTLNRVIERPEFTSQFHSKGVNGMEGALHQLHHGTGRQETALRHVLRPHQVEQVLSGEHGPDGGIAGIQGRIAAAIMAPGMERAGAKVTIPELEFSDRVKGYEKANQIMARVDRQEKMRPDAEKVDHLMRSIVHAAVTGGPNPEPPKLSKKYKRPAGRWSSNQDQAYTPEHIAEMRKHLEEIAASPNQQIKELHHTTIRAMQEHDDVMKKGSEIAARIDANPKVLAAIAEKERIDNEPALSGRFGHQDRADATSAVSKAYREAAIEELAKERSMGVGADTFPIKSVNNPRQRDQVAVIREAMTNYPSDWIAQSQGLKIDPSVRRGQYSSSRKTIRIGSGNSHGTAVHELGHHMEHMIPGLTAIEGAHLASRSKGDREKSLAGYKDKKEKAIEDEFFTAYAGKTYGGHFFEQFTMGAEALFGRNSGSYGRLVGLRGAKADPRLRAMVLGAMATLHRPKVESTP